MLDRTLIFDIGCNDGQDSDFYLKKGFRVVAVEANPDLCVGLRQRFAEQIAQGRFILVEKAIAEEVGQVAFYVNTVENIRSTIRSGHVERAAALGRPSKKIVVSAIKFSKLIEEFGVPYFMKVDIEGADSLCVEGLAPLKERPTFLSTEYPLTLAEQIRELLLLRKLGYKSFQLIDQSSVPLQLPPQPAREGQYTDHNFQFNASGLFGAELPGAWLTLGGAISRYMLLFVRNKRMGFLRRIPILRRFAGHGSWYDLHASARAARDTTPNTSHAAAGARAS